MAFSTLVYFYLRRLRSHPVQEGLAGLGIAIGVALVFAVQIANGSITNASRHVVASIVGVADVQVRARSEGGLPQTLVEEVRRLPGVRVAAPVLNLSGSVRAASGRSVAVQFASADATLPAIAGMARQLEQAHLTPREENLPGVLLPKATAERLAIAVHPSAGIARPAPVVSLLVRGHAVRANVLALLGPEDVGSLSDALAAVLDLENLQKVAATPGRITTILVQARRGSRAKVEEELRRLVGPGADVASATHDINLLRQATIPSDKATGFFAFVSALVGLLLAFGAMLMSIPERRRMIADLRIQGASPGSLAELLLFQALCLGVLASVAGILVGDVLSRSVFHQTPGYLALAFPLGTQTVIGWQPVVLSLLGGIVATCLATCPPLFDLRRSRAVDAVYHHGGEPGQALSIRTRTAMFALGGALLACSVLLPLLLGTSAAVVAIVCLAFAAVLTIPLAFTAVLKVVEAIATKVPDSNMLLVATRTLRSTTARSLALAATGAIAVYGTVAATGAHRDLLDGLYRDYSGYVTTTDLWVANPHDYLATGTFDATGLAARAAAVPGVRSVREYQGAFLDAYGRRIWVIARAPEAEGLIPAGQLVSGNRAGAERLLRTGGWAVVSAQIARQAHVGLGGVIAVPSPTGTVRLRLAATTTNLGWSPGAILLNRGDYRRRWGETAPTALEVDVSPSASVASVRGRVRDVLGAGSGLQVQTSAARAEEADALARNGLDRLTQIALLLTAAAVLAMTAAIGASIWQRRPALASLRIQGFRPFQLRVILMWESVLVIATGSAIGASAGVYGHALIDRYLRSVTGFPTAFSISLTDVVLAVCAIVGATLLLLAGPGAAASRVQPGLALREGG
ncbi:MAG TPA: FtsX-like permease family protein [Solirubrobacteraceae bacterium]|nr:FtsX-like permease family protein [Solirubrobacteraceae bacterium]